ncbi:hypothetical protein CLIB1444_11S03774 [[Candida] jaroonii]|uniref:Uncharacterized protein n=1 Tax=[Candida] jaroonii TaxID=467808 RepID=A0ACA9YCW0_9ASCO|nr:hypothetical protein CLIB1444_11S03774 [[Candida] jaroonii]
MIGTLLGTPRGNKVTNKSLEFTPIGKASTRNPTKPSDRSPLKPTTKFNLTTKVNKVDTFDTSFDATDFSHTINSPYYTQTVPVATTASANPPSNSMGNPPSNAMGNLLTGTVAVKQYQEDYHKLETENYNLKIQLKTLQRYFDKTPEELMTLVDENIDLKQKLYQFGTENKDLRRQLEQLANDESKKAATDDLTHHYEELLHKKHIDHQQEVDFLQQKLQEVQNNHHHQSNELKADFHDIQAENDHFIEEIRGLKDEIHDLSHSKSKLTSEFNALTQDIEAKDVEVEELRREVEIWKNRCHQATITDTVAADSTAKELLHVQNQLDESQYQYQSLKTKYDTLKTHHDTTKAQLEDVTAQLHDIQSQLHQVQYQYDTTKNHLDNLRQENQHISSQQFTGEFNSDKLTQEIQYLTEELKAREKSEANLRAQINALIKDKSTTNFNAYQAQIDSLTQSEAKLTDINKKLRSEIATLKDELFLSNTKSNDSKILSLQNQNSKLNDKLQYYENEFETVENALKVAENDIKLLQDKLSTLNGSYHELEQDNIALVNQIKSRGSEALSELDHVTQKKLQFENHQLEQEIQSLQNQIIGLKKNAEDAEEFQYEIKRLKREVENNRNDDYIEQLTAEINRLKRSGPTTATTPSFLEHEYQRMVMERNQLQMEVDTTANRLRDMENKYKKLQLSYEDKENLLDEMELKLRDLKRATKFTQLEDDDEKNQFLRARANYETKIKVLELENESIRKEYDSQVQYYKTKLAMDKERGPMTPPESPVVSVLERQVEEAFKEKAEVGKELAQVRWEILELQGKLVKAETELSTAKSELTTVRSELGTTKSELTTARSELGTARSELTTTKTQNDRLLDINNAFELNEKQLKQKLANTTEELDKVTRHCHKLVSKLNDRLKVDDLNNRFASTNLSPTPRRNNRDDQLRYYKAKIYDLNLKCNDLQVMYNYVSQCLEGTKKVREMMGVEKQTKLTFAVVAKMVLAAVKMKKRQERSDRRRVVLKSLRS